MDDENAEYVDDDNAEYVDDADDDYAEYADDDCVECENVDMHHLHIGEGLNSTQYLYHIGHPLLDFYNDC